MAMGDAGLAMPMGDTAVVATGNFTEAVGSGAANAAAAKPLAKVGVANVAEAGCINVGDTAVAIGVTD